MIRLGLTGEAEEYMKFIEQRCAQLVCDFYLMNVCLTIIKNSDGSLQVMYSIEGKKELPEVELSHFEGYKGSKPVRIGNGAHDHLQLDIYGALLDCVYLYNKYRSPISYDLWCKVRKLVDYGNYYFVYRYIHV